MTIVHDILKHMPGLGEPQRKFLATLFVTVLVLRGRVNFRNLSRYCDYSERTIARQFREPFDWPDFHQRVLLTALDPHSELDIIGDSVDLLYANLCNPPRQTARVSGRDRTDTQRVCACAASLCCGLYRPLSSRQDLGREGAPTPERRRRQRRLIPAGRQTALHPCLSEDQSAANHAWLAI